MHASHSIGRIAALLLGIGLLPASALAWNPYPEASNPPPAEQTMAPRAPSMGTWRRPVISPPAYPTPMTVIYQPAPTAVAAPVAAVPPVAPAPPAASPAALVYQPAPAYVPPPVASAPVYAAPPPMAVADAMPVATAAPQPTPRTTRQRDQPYGEWHLGLEAFYDRYREPIVDVTTQTKYIALTGAYDYYEAGSGFGWYTGAELRASMGDSNYKSGSGKLDSVPEQEYEARWKLGYSFAPTDVQWVPYSGFAARYYRDDLKGEVTDQGKLGYDRNILQLYLPVGMDVLSHYGAWDVKTNVEYDALVAGYVSSRLGTISGLENAFNHQHAGYGLRASVMFSQTLGNGGAYEFGPFVRWWDMEDSSVDSQAAGDLYEPANTRLQVGGALRYRF